MRVATIEGSEPNKQVQNQLSTYNALKQQFDAGKMQFNQETDPLKKKELEAQLNKRFERLNAMKENLRATYGVSVDRPYVIMTEQANLYLDQSNIPQPQPILEGGAKDISTQEPVSRDL